MLELKKFPIIADLNKHSSILKKNYINIQETGNKTIINTK